MAKTLIAFYSRAGQNYVSGDIVDLEVGNTEVIANKFSDCLTMPTSSKSTL
jgi:flavodoxin